MRLNWSAARGQQGNQQHMWRMHRSLVVASGQESQAMTDNKTIWLTVVLPLWLLAAMMALGQWFWLRRQRKKWQREQNPDPEIVAAGRRLYDDGEFRRAIVERTPVSLFSDKVKLSCGHETEEARSSEATQVNCHQCARQWIQQQSSLLARR
jgi:hypothetical protein